MADHAAPTPAPAPAAGLPSSGTAWVTRTGIGLAVGVSAIVTWLLQLLAGHVLGVEGYARFMVLWGLFFTVVGILQGLQQEVTRAAISAPGGSTGARVMGVAGTVGGIGAVVLAGSWLVGAGLSSAPHPYLLVVAVACALYAIAQGLNGALAAQRAWGTYAWAVALEGVTRAVVFSAAILLSHDETVLAIGLTGGILAWVLVGGTAPLRRCWQLRGDVGVMGMLTGVAQAMAATGCSALLISGFPLLLSVTSSKADERQAGVLLAVLVATRTPLLLFLNAYQGPILTHLIAVRSPLRLLARWCAAAIGLGAVGGVVSYFAGGPVIRLAYGPGFDARPAVFPAVVAAGLALSLLTVTGWALLAGSRHTVYLAGWVLATVTTASLLALDLPIEVRVPLALVLGPLVGTALHLLALLADRTRSPQKATVVASPL